jgi:chorismate-pyruvate lyase
MRLGMATTSEGIARKNEERFLVTAQTALGRLLRSHDNVKQIQSTHASGKRSMQHPLGRGEPQVSLWYREKRLRLGTTTTSEGIARKNEERFLVTAQTALGRLLRSLGMTT